MSTTLHTELAARAAAATLPPELQAALDRYAKAPDILTTHGAAQILDVHSASVLGMVDRGEILALPGLIAGRIRIPKSEILRLLTPIENGAA